MYTDTNICIITGRVDCKERSCELHYMDAPIELSARDCEKENAMRWQQELTALGIEYYMIQDRDYLD